MAPAQALLLLLAEDRLSTLLPPSMRSTLQANFHTARAALADPANAPYADWLAGLRDFTQWDQVLAQPQTDPTIRDLLQEALFKHHRLDILYRGRAATIHPFGWATRNGIPYLACTFWDYRNPVWLAVHRIAHATDLEMPAEPNLSARERAEFLAKPIMAPSEQATALDLQLEFPAHLHRFIQDRPPLDVDGQPVSVGAIEGGHFLVTGQVPDSAGLRWWLLGFNDQVRIIQPTTLKQELHPLLYDRLTGLFTRTEFAIALHRRLAESQRTHAPLALCMLDIDRFKAVNDHFGHDVGDRALQHVAHCLHGICRDMDLAARFGGEEFVLLLPDTSCDEACAFAERLRRSLLEGTVRNGATFGGPLPLEAACAGIAEQLLAEQPRPDPLSGIVAPSIANRLGRLPDGQYQLALTASIGVTCYAGQSTPLSLKQLGERLLKCADDATYQAKRERNCVRSATC